MFREVPASGHPLLYYLVAHVWNGFGSGEVWFRMVSCIAGVVTIWLMYLLGKELISRPAGLWAAAFAAFSPYLIWYSRDATDYSWLVAMATLSLYFLVRSARRGGWANWTIYVLVSAAALALFTIPWALSNRSASSFAVLHLPSTPTLNALVMSPVALTKGYASYRFGSGAAALGANRIDKLSFILVALYITGLVIWSKPLRKAMRGKLGLAVYLCTVILIAVPVLLRAQDTAGRYLALAAPRRMGAIAGGLILTALIGFTVFQFVRTHNDNWRGVISEITNEGRPGDSILCFPLHNCAMALDIYSTEPPPLLGGNISSGDHNIVNLQVVPGWHGYLDGYGGAENFPAYTGPALEGALRDRLAGVSGIWLVAGTGELGHYPPSDVIDQALNDDWKLMDVLDFNPLQVKHYERRQG
ncbi:MAG: glycosyltransferase family 39 protein [Thermoleophilia bacterium]